MTLVDVLQKTSVIEFEDKHTIRDDLSGKDEPENQPGLSAQRGIPSTLDLSKQSLGGEVSGQVVLVGDSLPIETDARLRLAAAQT